MGAFEGEQGGERAGGPRAERLGGRGTACSPFSLRSWPMAKMECLKFYQGSSLWKSFIIIIITFVDDIG